MWVFRGEEAEIERGVEKSKGFQHKGTKAPRRKQKLLTIKVLDEEGEVGEGDLAVAVEVGHGKSFG